jgi:predicted DNA-binding transcriptional regulator YafY
MAEHLYMFSGSSVSARLVADASVVSDIVDWFGADVRMTELPGGRVEASVRVNEEAMFYWCLQYGQYVELLEPAGLRERVRAAVAGMAEKYERKGSN